MRPTGLALGVERFQPMASSVALGLGSRASTGHIRVVCGGRKRAQTSGFGLRLPEPSLRVVKVAAKDKKSSDGAKGKAQKKKKLKQTEENLKAVHKAVNDNLMKAMEEMWQREEQRWLREEKRWQREQKRWETDREEWKEREEALLTTIAELQAQVQALQGTAAPPPPASAATTPRAA
eukprot:CAMPEP_0118945704 /NCGR_PEP_ID=MMETSP1169-20130426/42790_1 /TAXON_ID=36882 /ORGANISM="Pyramimonas obovata, Strain CCMP722" /LENGTH=177 /DNA_ID=CAMNT_0006891483 /DNA_START=25 /DNA_END=555 /DNA_ORIENTATION=-